MGIERAILTQDFLKSAHVVLKTSSWAGREWDRQLTKLVETSKNTGKIPLEVAETIIDENKRTECGREGVAGIVWYTMNRNAYPRKEVAADIVMNTCLHLFALRLADNYVDESDKEHSLDRLLSLKNKDVDEHPLARAAKFLLDECTKKFGKNKGYLGVCQRLFDTAVKVEKYRDSASVEQLEALDKEVCFMTVFPVAFLTEQFSGKPKRNSSLALRSMLYAARIMDYLGDFKKDFVGGGTYNGLLSRVKEKVPADTNYTHLRAEVEKIRPEITNRVLDEIKKGSCLLDPVAAGMYWFASLLMYTKYLTQYKLLTGQHTEISLKIAKNFVRSL